jgi:hypothetical protein
MVELALVDYFVMGEAIGIVATLFGFTTLADTMMSISSNIAADHKLSIIIYTNFSYLKTFGQLCVDKNLDT